MPPPPPETELDYGAPISSQRYVYVAMTAQDELARIDGATLAVTSTQVGHAPQGRRDDPRQRWRGRARLDERHRDGRAARR